MSEQLKKFYKLKAKKPDLAGYDDNGNLIELNTDGAILNTIPLPTYRALSYEEYDEINKNRLEAIAVANKEYEDARKLLRDAHINPGSSTSDILRLNRAVAEADIKLQNIRFPLKYVEKVSGVNIRDVNFNESKETRKYLYELAILATNPYNLQEQYVRVGEVAPKPMISVAEANLKENQGIPVILFSNPDTNEYGFLSLKWVVNIEFESVKYNSAQQALYAELAKKFNDEANLKDIMGAETPEEIQYTIDDVPGNIDENQSKWNQYMQSLILDVNMAKFKQYPELARKLLDTKNAQLGAYEPNDTLIGIGISLDNIQAKNPINWTGQNLLGKALMNIREYIRSEMAVEATPAIVTKDAEKPIARPRKRPVPPKVSTPEPTVVEQVAEAASQITQPIINAAQPAVDLVTSFIQPTPSTEVTQPVGIPRPIRRRPKIAEV
jgi:ribA/ribD-fused uncharacterized protein